MEIAAKKEKKLYEQKIAKVEENAKVMEELLQETQFQKEEMSAKLEEQERKGVFLESKISPSLRSRRGKEFFWRIKSLRRRVPIKTCRPKF